MPRDARQPIAESGAQIAGPGQFAPKSLHDCVPRPNFGRHFFWVGSQYGGVVDGEQSESAAQGSFGASSAWQVPVSEPVMTAQRSDEAHGACVLHDAPCVFAGRQILLPPIDPQNVPPPQTSPGSAHGSPWFLATLSAQMEFEQTRLLWQS